MWSQLAHPKHNLELHLSLQPFNFTDFFNFSSLIQNVIFKSDLYFKILFYQTVLQFFLNIFDHFQLLRFLKFYSILVLLFVVFLFFFFYFRSLHLSTNLLLIVDQICQTLAMHFSSCYNDNKTES